MVSREFGSEGHEFSDWSDDEIRLFENLDLPESAENDAWVHMLYDMAYFSPELDYETHRAVQSGLSDYLAVEYGFDFDTSFDWDGYRALPEVGDTA